MSVIGIPALSFVHEMGKAGKIFLWNPYISMGVPVWASSLGNCFYVFNAFFLIFEPFKNILAFFILHQIMAGLTAYYYLRGNRFCRIASLVGGLLYSFSAARIYYMHNIERYALLTFAPLILLLTDRLIEKTSIKQAILLSLAFGFLTASGEMQMLTIYTMVFLSYGLLRAYQAKKLFRLKTFALLMLIVLIVSGIASILIFPVMELNTQSPFRAVPLAYEQVTAGSLAPWNMLLVPFANFLGDADTVLKRAGVSPWEHTYFSGFTVIALSLMAFVFPRKKRKALLFFFLAVMGVGLFFALGVNNPLYPFLYKHCRFFSHFRYVSRFLVVTPVFIMFVSAAGIENLRLFLFKKNLVPKNLISSCRKVFMFFFIFVVLWFVLFLSVGYKSSSNTVLFLLSAGLPVVFLGLASSKRSIPLKRIAVVYILIFAAVLVNMAEPLIFVEKAYLVNPDSFRNFREELAFLENVKSQISTPFPRIFYPLNPNRTSAAGLCNTNGYFPLDMKNYTEYIYAAFTGRRMDSSAFSRMTHYTFHPLNLMQEVPLREAQDGNRPPPAGINWKQIYHTRLSGNPMYRMLCPAFTILPDGFFNEKDYLGRFWFSRGYKVIKNEDETLETLMKGDFDPLNEVIIPEEPEPYDENMSKECSTGGKAVITYFSPDEIHVAMSGQWGWLTMSDRYYPGWRVLVDRKPVPVYRGNYLFRTVFIPPGSNYLFLRYDPPEFRKGLAIFTITLFCSLLLYVALSLMERR